MRHRPADRYQGKGLKPQQIKLAKEYIEGRGGAAVLDPLMQYLSQCEPFTPAQCIYMLA